MKCPICDSILAQLFRAKILNKYGINYLRCNECGLIKTEDPYWFEDAYSEAIADLDVGLVSRNMNLVPTVSHIIEEYFDYDNIFLDYAGGYGLFVRMMRDQGYNFYRQDKYCQNIFAKYFDLENCDFNIRFELITAFEFLEHVVNPLKELSSLLTLSDSIILSTELQPKNILSIDDWWYFAPETGQHITFYTKKTFECMAVKLGLNYYSIGKNLHLLTRKDLDVPNFSKETKFCSVFCRIFKRILTGLSLKTPVEKRKSLVWDDFKFVKSIILEDN